MIFQKTAFNKVISTALLSQLLLMGPGFAQTSTPTKEIRASIRVGTKGEDAPQPAQRPGNPSVMDAGTTAGGSSFLLPFDPNLKGPQAMDAPTPLYNLSAEKVDIDSDFGGLVNNLLDAGIFKEAQYHVLDQAVARYRSPKMAKFQQYKDQVSYGLCYRGCDSHEVSDVILNKEKVQVKNQASAEYARQLRIDEVHPKIVSALMQVAMGLGLKDAARSQKTVYAGIDSLRPIVGDQNAEDTLDKLATWTKQTVVPPSIYRQERWDVATSQEKLRDTVKMSFEGDPVVRELVNQVSKFHKSKAARGARTSIPLAFTVLEWLAPGYVIPLGFGLMENGYIQATGGSEDKKLTQELYYDKRLESRWRVINEEAQMALTQYQNALATRNRTLLIASETVLTQLVGAENVDKIVTRPVLAHVAPAPEPPSDKRKKGITRTASGHSSGTQ